MRFGPLAATCFIKGRERSHHNITSKATGGIGAFGRRQRDTWLRIAERKAEADYDKDSGAIRSGPSSGLQKRKFPHWVGGQALPPYAKDGPTWKVLPFTGM